MTITIDHRWRVRAEASFDLPVSAGAAWGQMRDWRRFLTIDPLHARLDDIRSPAKPSPAGTTFLLRHRLLGVGPTRRGRLLSWHEGRGYAISDLSRRPGRVGFPHVCTYAVESIDADRCRVTLGARGLWTATRGPRWLVRLWLAWVLRATESRVRAEFDAYAAWLAPRR